MSGGNTMRITRVVACSVICVLAVLGAALGAGSMTPPPDAMSNGVPVATMKSMEDIEPRTAIESLPYTITQSGSYYLTHALEGSNGVTIASGDVVLDLGGFSIKGLLVGGTSGITMSNNIPGVTIKNGSVTMWGGWGIDGLDADSCQILNVRCSLNSTGGMRVGNDCLIQDSSALDNSGDGITMGEGCTIHNCKAARNSNDGICAGFGSKIETCTAMYSGAAGIRAGIYSVVRDCSLIENEAHGIEVSSSCRAENNTCGNNGKVDGGAGIHVTGPGNRIKDNNITANDGGILVGEDGNWIEGNSLIDNNIGLQVLGVGNFIIRNGVGTPLNTNSPVHFVIADSNQCAQILENLGTSFTNANPWANIRLTPE